LLQGQGNIQRRLQEIHGNVEAIDRGLQRLEPQTQAWLVEVTAYLKTNYVGCTRLADLLIMNPDDLADELRACVKNYGDLLRVAYAPSAAAVMLGSPADGDAYWEAVRRLGFPPERWAERPFLPVNQPSAAGAVPAV